MDGTAKKIVVSAMEATQHVNNMQNNERKKFLEHIKKGMSARLQVKKAWQQLIEQLTHERWVKRICRDRLFIDSLANTEDFIL